LDYRFFLIFKPWKEYSSVPIGWSLRKFANS